MASLTRPHDRAVVHRLCCAADATDGSHTPGPCLCHVKTAHRVQLALAGGDGQVATVFLQRLVFALRVLVRHAVAAAHLPRSRPPSTIVGNK